MKMELSSKIFVSILGIALIAVIISSLMFFSVTKVSFEGIIEETQVNLAEGAVSEIGQHLQMRVDEIRDMSQLSSLGLNAAADNYLHEFGYEVFNSIAVTDESGYIIAQNNEIDDEFSGDKEWWKQARDEGIYVENINFDEDQKMHYLGISVSIKDSNNNFAGVIKADLNFQKIINIVKGFRASGINFTKNNNVAYASEKHRTMEFRLIDDQGKLLYSTEDEDFNQFEYLSANMLSKLDGEDNNTFSYISNDQRDQNIKKLITYYPFKGFNEIKNLNWGILIGHEIEDVFYPARNAALTMALYMIPLLFIAGIAMVFTIKKIVIKPLRQFSYATKSIAEGNLNNYVDIQSSDEIGMLANSFNKMTDELKLSKQNVEAKVAKRTEELHKFQLAVENASELTIITDANEVILYANPAIVKITGYKIEQVIGKKAGSLWGGSKLWESVKKDKKMYSGEVENKHKDGRSIISKMDIYPILNEQNDLMFLVGISRDITKEKEVDRMKTEFISLASHQLRTPLSAMKWFSEMLLDGDAGELSEEQKEYILKINESNERMISLVNSLLNVSRIETGKIVLEPKETDIKAMVNELAEELGQKIKEKNLTLNLNLADDITAVVVDPKMTAEVYSNLMTNAVKYTPNNGEISVNVVLKDGKLVSKIQDNGLGIPKSEQNKLFQKFFRGTNVLKNDTDGNGLGMYLVKRIVEASGGDISYESEEDKGTTFKFSLPENVLEYKQPE